MSYSLLYQTYPLLHTLKLCALDKSQNVIWEKKCISKLYVQISFSLYSAWRFLRHLTKTISLFIAQNLPLFHSSHFPLFLPYFVPSFLSSCLSTFFLFSPPQCQWKTYGQPEFPFFPRNQEPSSLRCQQMLTRNHGFLFSPKRIKTTLSHYRACQKKPATSAGLNMI